MRTIPTLKQLYDGIIADLESSQAFLITIPIFGKVFLRALAGVQALRLKMYYLALAAVQKNIFVDTADSESMGGTLERFGRVKLNRNPFPARQGQYYIQVTGTIGAIITASTTFKTNDDAVNPGKLFILDTAYTLIATTDTIRVRALEAGEDSKMEVGDNLTATKPIALVDAGAVVSAIFLEPLAAEDLEDYRQSALDAYRLEPQGGAMTDYRLWSNDVQGVEQVYPYAKSGAAGELNVFVEATVADSTDGFGTPSALMLADVEDVIEFDPDTSKPLNERGRRPIGRFDVHVLPVTIKQVNINIAGFVGNTAAITATILAAMTTAINAIRPFVAGADILEDRNDILDTNKIIAVILNARPGSVFGAITLTVAGTPYSTYSFMNGDIPHLNNITYS